jgi:ATP-dependent helicase/nuclease subunit A
VDVHALARPEFEGPERSQEEEKRLLYVAFTRARRHLFLCASKLAESEGKPTLFQLLPESLRAIMQDALTTEETEIAWSPGEVKHRLRLVTAEPQPRRYRRVEKTPDYRLALEPIEDTSVRRLTLSTLVRDRAEEPIIPWALDPVDLAVGTTVHRLFEYAVPLDESLQDVTRTVLPDLPGKTPAERQEATRKAADFYAWLSRQPELDRLMKEGEVHREVPFALVHEGRVLRGMIDSLVLLPGRIVVIDYKTGGARSEHKMQMELYLEAARVLFPQKDMEGLVFYPQGDPLRYFPKENGDRHDFL